MAETTARRRRRTAKPKIVEVPGDDDVAEQGSADSEVVLEYLPLIKDARKSQGAASTHVASLYNAAGKAGVHTSALKKVVELDAFDENKRRKWLRAFWQYIGDCGLNDYDQADLEDLGTSEGPAPQFSAAG